MLLLLLRIKLKGFIESSKRLERGGIVESANWSLVSIPSSL